MTGPRLEVPGQTWSAAEFAVEVADREHALHSELRAGQSIFRFPAPAVAESVWTFHALKKLGIVALPMPPKSSEGLTTAYTNAATLAPDRATQRWLRTSGRAGAPKVVDLTSTQLQASVTASHARLGCSAVSYTHLTQPPILLV